MLDDEYLNGQARLCGIYATGVYMSLCRHASKDQECFPSINLIADELAISRPSVIKGLKSLETHNVISIQKRRTKGGKWLANIYILLDKSEWSKYKQQVIQVNEVDSVESTIQVNDRYTPSQRGLPSQVNEVDSKETHSKETQFKETHIAGVPAKVKQSSDLMEDQQKHIQIIGLYANYKKVVFDNKQHQQEYIARNIRAAKKLTAYEGKKIYLTMEYLDKKADFKWTLETVSKYIDDPSYMESNFNKSKTITI